MEEMQGVMALPQVQGMGISPGDMQVLQQIRQNIPRQEVTQEFLSAGEQIDPQAVAAFKEELAALDLDKQSLDKLNEMVDTILAAPQDYASLRRAYLEEGFPEEVLPEQFDPGFFAALNMAIDVMIMNQGSRPPMAMARGGIADLAAYGRYGDTMLAHITPEEAALLQQMGGSGTINPVTGLPEFFVKWAAKQLKSAIKSVGNAVKKFAQSTVGKVIIGAGLAIFGGPLAAGFLSGAAGSVGLSGLSSFLVSKVGMAAVGGFLAGAGTTLASGGNLKQALRAGAIGAVGAGAFTGVAGAIQGASASDLFSAPPTPTDVVSTGAGQAGTSGATVPLDRSLGTSLTEVAQESSGNLRPGDFVQGSPNTGPGVYTRTMDGTVFTSGGQPSVDPLTRLQEPMTPFEPLPVGSTASQGPPTEAIPTPKLSGPPAIAPGSTPALNASLSPGSGVMDALREGRIGDAASNALDKTIDFFNPNSVDPNAVVKATDAANKARLMAYNENLLKLGGDPTKLSAAQEQLLTNLSNDAGQRAYDAAFKAATPGVLTRYAPLAGLGIAGLAASGAFSTKRPDVEKPEEFQGPTGYQKYYMNPTIYGLEFGGIRPTSFGDRYGFPGYAKGGGVMDTPQAMRVGGKTYPRKVGSINGPGTGTSDSIPAMLSDGEFVFTAKAVRAMGNGSRRKGAKKMYQLMKMLEGKSA